MQLRYLKLEIPAVAWLYELPVAPYTKGSGTLSVIADDVDITVGLRLCQPERELGEWVVARAQVARREINALLNFLIEFFDQFVISEILSRCPKFL